MSYSFTICDDARKTPGLDECWPDTKTIRLNQSIEVQTPVSLRPVVRNLSSGFIAARSVDPQSFDDNEYDLFHQQLSDGPLLGHMAGAITLLWFNSWQQVKAVLQNEQSPNTMKRPQNVCFLRYLKFLVTSAKITGHTLMASLLYFLRFREMAAGPVCGSPTSEARILVAALMAADKHENDVSYTTSTWAKLSDIDPQEVKKMEIEFLMGLQFNLHITPTDWQRFNNFVDTTLFPLVERLTLG